MVHTSREKKPRFAPLCASESLTYPEKQRKIMPLCQSTQPHGKHCLNGVDRHGKLPDTLNQAIKTYHKRPSRSPFRNFTHFIVAHEK
ncbi:hypothetical protein PFISCL1PPCAC_20149 [Pristionchus fissidentatus]|uniref:Ribosomal protein n=1 Tax=Pristionchus fissidentatus TaxID=1538716 RepID=A0AAV5WAJ3_9BILA|nr:hypothetical protein PFISCL1PPCAC_20149 [Pristionchus fissidentatus]